MIDYNPPLPPAPVVVAAIVLVGDTELDEAEVIIPVGVSSWITANNPGAGGMALALLLALVVAE